MDRPRFYRKFTWSFDCVWAVLVEWWLDLTWPHRVIRPRATDVRLYQHMPDEEDLTC